ncbi:unnamed protein product [Mytilus edulis]|uniref:Uncharacterized protein n=1 Tax=Mytilus edulis TaxID=6550 RepID=A0A8S3T4G6_MYTED|nr:unnamed protein product [Mytilus edulis]
MDIGSNESWNTSKDDFQLVSGTSPTRTASSIHDNGCKSLHNIKAAVNACEDEPTTAPLPVIPAQEPTVRYQEEPILIETDGGAHVGSGVTPGTPLRLLIVSSKIRNSNAFRTAILSNVVFVQYKYESASLDSLQSMLSLEILGVPKGLLLCNNKM